MNYKLLAAILAFLLPIACGGGGSSSTAPGDTVAAPASGGAPAAPGSDAGPAPAPATGSPPATPTTDPAAAPPSGGPAAPGATPDEASCSESFNFASGRADYDERCTAGGKTTSRECTLESGGSAWSCMCTAASGSRSTCQSAAPSGVITAPDDCCPAP